MIALEMRCPLASTSGCLGFLTGSEPLEESARPARVQSNVSESTGYELQGIEEQTLEETFEIDGHTYRQHDESTLADPVAPIIRTERELYRDGELVWETTFDLKAVYRREMELLVRLAGFSDWTVYGDFDRSPVTAESTEQVWVIEN